MSEKLTKLIVSTILNNGVKSSEVQDWHFKVRQVDGIYYFDVSTIIAVSPKKELTKQEKRSKFLIIAFVISFCLMVALSTIGLLIPSAFLGRDLVYLSTFPGFIAQLIGARFVIRGVRKQQNHAEPVSAIPVERTQDARRAGSSNPKESEPVLEKC